MNSQEARNALALLLGCQHTLSGDAIMRGFVPTISALQTYASKQAEIEAEIERTTNQTAQPSPVDAPVDQPPAEPAAAAP